MNYRAENYRANTRGFTLIEVMISLTIFALIAAFSYATFSQVASASRRVSQNMEAVHALQRTFTFLSNDFAQLQPRSVREPLGGSSRPALLADSRNEYLVELTRGGHANPLRLPRASAQRVAYRVEEGQLIRMQWANLDTVLSVEPIEAVLMENVTAIEIRFLGASGEWQTQWPSLGGGTASPRAVEIVIEHEDWGEVRRLIEVAG